MAAVAHDPAFAKRVGVPQSVGRKFAKADKGRTFGDAEMKNMKMGGMAPKMGKAMAGGKKAHGEHSVQKKGHTKAKQIAMRKGGKVC
jgi:hypothetical protein